MARVCSVEQIDIECVYVCVCQCVGVCECMYVYGEWNGVLVHSVGALLVKMCGC